MIRKTIHSFVFLLLLSSCDSLELTSYLAEQGFKQGSILLRSKNIETLLKDPHLSEERRRYFILTKRVLNFAKNEMHLKTGRSYQRFYDLKRPYVSQIVMAAQADKLEPYLFSFPVVGELPYKGFFDEMDAAAFEAELKSKGLDTYRRNVAAFSGLGYFPDPLLNSMLISEIDLTELILHELTHQTVYLDSDADFNEALATWVGLEGARIFLSKYPHYFKDAKNSKQELEEDFEREQSLSKAVKDLIAEGKILYLKEEDKSKRMILRNSFLKTVKERFALNEKLKNYSKLEWNHAVLLSLATYYERIEEAKTKAHEIAELKNTLKFLNANKIMTR